jgi:hypothetical protein
LLFDARATKIYKSAERNFLYPSGTFFPKLAPRPTDDAPENHEYGHDEIG